VGTNFHDMARDRCNLAQAANTACFRWHGGRSRYSLMCAVPVGHLHRLLGVMEMPSWHA